MKRRAARGRGRRRLYGRDGGSTRVTEHRENNVSAFKSGAGCNAECAESEDEG
jgi:hypothetical protein